MGKGRRERESSLWEKERERERENMRMVKWVVYAYTGERGMIYIGRGKARTRIF